ncbi:hypothetical protein [Thioclava sp. DLFJ4-1]|uniref:hypothetical protein n=1 Tax=Thioclava sp. DLFJ4-1 TaxID=1915313 RepID=UPI00099823BD|nr:hypothetical protein [Thioclava sp. DLFJ4-1]OOY15091.1 hypothetical protein BMI85_16220 [Thioclava sp. DLFJ4-1]
MTDMTVETAGVLFEIRCRGMIARMYALRNVEPTKEVWGYILDEEELTLRTIGEIAHELGFHVDAVFQNADVPEVLE